MIMARLPKLLVNAHLIKNEPHPDTPGYLLHVQLFHDRDRGWWEVTATECYGARRSTAQRFTEEQEARDALERVYAAHGPEQGTWQVKAYGR